MDLLVIAEEAKSSPKYEALIKSIREDSNQKDLAPNHPGSEFTKDKFVRLHIIDTKRGPLVYLEEKLVPLLKLGRSSSQNSTSPTHMK